MKTDVTVNKKAKPTSQCLSIGSKTNWLLLSHRESDAIQQVECDAWHGMLRDLHAHAHTNTTTL